MSNYFNQSTEGTQVTGEAVTVGGLTEVTLAHDNFFDLTMYSDEALTTEISSDYYTLGAEDTDYSGYNKITLTSDIYSTYTTVYVTYKSKGDYVDAADMNAKVDIVDTATENNFASFNDSGSIKDSTKSASDFATSTHNHDSDYADITHVSDTTNPHSVDKTDVGLGNVDNTSDANKPISSATQSALDGKENSLGNPDTDGKVLSSTAAGVRSWVAAGSGSGDMLQSTYDTDGDGTVNEADSAKSLDDGAGNTATVANIVDAISKEHEHSNKATLDTIGADDLFDINGKSEIATLANADEFGVYDDTAGSIMKVTYANLRDNIQSGQLSIVSKTAGDWTIDNPILETTEIGYETDTGKIKIGNGSDNWIALSYTYVDTNTQNTIDDSPSDGETTHSISSNWAYNHENNSDLSTGLTHVPDNSTAADNSFLAKDGTWQVPSGTGTGEANDGINIGTAGVGIYDSKSGVNLQFKKLNAGSSKVTITDDIANDEVDIDVDTSNFGLDSSDISDFDTAVNTNTTVAGKADKDSDAVENNLAKFDSTGTPIDADIKVNDSGTTTSDIWTANKITSELSDKADSTSIPTTIAELDVNAAALDDGKTLEWDTDTSQWVYVTYNNYTHPNHTGDVTSTGDGATVIANKQTLTASNGVNVSNTPEVIATVAPEITLTYGTTANTVCEGNDSRLSDARTPTTHDLAGSEHGTSTLSELNSKISDATLIDTDDSRLSDSRTPTSHTHPLSELSQSTATDGQVVLWNTAAWEATTLAASNISDFDTEVSNNTDVAANTTARHDAITVSDSTEIDFTLTGQDITASLIDGSIALARLAASVQTSLGLADSALQNGDNVSVLTNDAGYVTDISGKADKTNVLELDNTTVFTPDADYEPATKKYVDESIPAVPVDSVNGEIGVVSLDADDIDDSTTAHKFVTADDITNLGNLSGTNTGDETTASIKTTLGAAATDSDGYLTSTDWNTFNGKSDFDGAYSSLTGTPNIPTVNDSITDGNTTSAPSENAVHDALENKQNIIITGTGETSSLSGDLPNGTIYIKYTA